MDDRSTPGVNAAAAAPTPRSKTGTRLGKLLLLLTATGLAALHVRLAWRAELQLDEFQYAHGGWLIGRGGTIYVDFFEHHFPLLHQLLGVVWRFLADDPTHILTLRMLFLPVFGLVVVAGCLANRSPADQPTWRDAAWWTAPVLLSIPTLSAMGTQLRPDVLALALFFLTLALLRAAGSPRPGRRRLLAALAGAVAVASLWATLKVAIYAGVPFLAALAADLLRRRARHDRSTAPDDSTDLDDEETYLLGDPVAFVAGSGVAALGVGLYLVVTGSLGAWWHWAVGFAFAHQEVYPTFPWTRNFFQLLDHSAWLLPLATVGLVVTVRRRPAAGDTDWLLLAAVPTTAASFVWQTAPYLYSLLPLTAVLGLFAARGLFWCWSCCGSWRGSRFGASGQAKGGGSAVSTPRVFLAALVVLLALGEVHRSVQALDRLGQRTNEKQLQTLARLGEMTNPGDAVFSPWAMQVARPSAHFFYFLEAATKRLETERLHRELVPALRDRGVTVYVHHHLSERLPAPAWHYLRTHFLPFDEDLWIYGRRYPVNEGRGGGDFFAVQEGVYFVSPPEALGGGQVLRIDGIELSGPIVKMGRGPHRVEYEGLADEVSIVWMPRDGIPFPPRPELLPAD